MRHIDLHLHSTASDGAYAPARLMEMAHARGLSAVALTDHDTVVGCEPAARRAAELGMEFVPGIELEAAHARGTLHILGYFVDVDSPALRAATDRAVQRRAERNQAIRDRLQSLGIVFSEYELGGRDMAALGRPHFAEALVRLGHARNFRAAFDAFLGDRGRAYVPLTLSRAVDVIGSIRAAGGIAALAHPVRLRYASLLELQTTLKHLRAAGLAAVEVWHPSHTPAQSRDFEIMADSLGLLATGGSDFHRLPPRAERGVGFSRVRVRYAVLESLRAAHVARAGG